MRPLSFGMLKKEGTERWLYEALHRLTEGVEEARQGLEAITRGEAPDSSGGPIVDNTKFFYKPGLPGGQTGFGDVAASGNLTFSSTANDAKGKIFLGTASAYDEANAALGIGITSPTAGLHVVANPQPGALLPNSDITTGNWGRFGTGGGASPFPSSDWENINTNDGETSMLARSDVVGAWTDQVGMNGSVSPASSITVVVYLKVLFSDSFVAGRYNFSIKVYDSAGISYSAASIDASTVGNAGFVATNFVCTPDGGATSTPNSVKYISTVSSGAGTKYLAITLISVSSAGGGQVQAVARFKNSAATSLNNTEWLNESGTLVAHVDTAGQGQFQNLILEDPGAGTNTITLKTPSAPTTHTLTFPSAPVAGGLLKTDGSGVLSWALASSLATRVQFEWRANGPFQTGTEVDGQLRIPTAMTISSVRLYRKTAGSSGSTIVDLNKNGTTMFTTQANRPTITAASGNNQASSGTLPDVTSVAAGDVLSMDIDQIEGGTPADCVLIIEGA
jgi:hypothetical protein